MKKLFIFGSTGDLVKRKVLPALEFFEDIKVILLGRKDLNNESFNKNYCTNCSEELKKRLNYKKINFEESYCNACLRDIPENETAYFYISLPPNLILPVLKELSYLKKSRLSIKILIEKPLGNNLLEAIKIQEFIEENDLGEDIFFADHYLFKEGFKEFLSFYDNSIKKTNKGFEKLEIVSLEEEGINNRVYYDDVGAIKDMIQSHFMDILMKILEKERHDLLREILNLEQDYNAKGKIERFYDEIIEGYKLIIEKMIEIRLIKIGQYKNYEKEINKKSDTETYAKINFLIKNKSNKIKEITFETGKSLDKKESYLNVDNKKFYLDKGKNPYFYMFDKFFNEKREDFPKIEEIIFSWAFIEKVTGEIKKSRIILEKY